MLRTAQSLPPTGLSTLGFDPTRYQTEPPACYRASWQLPGRDSHPLAATSLCSDQVNLIAPPPKRWAHVAGPAERDMQRHLLDEWGQAACRRSALVRQAPSIVRPGQRTDQRGQRRLAPLPAWKEVGVQA